ncbi:uncharacterized protein [Aquarana catesbeiana]|uniref:uncharacterized protein isoform X2 n=1 Tax=Aquarana catesbeiana TaxID=8400 RepID=UPI003CC9B3B3
MVTTGTPNRQRRMNQSRTSSRWRMSLLDSKYLSSIKGAQDFISMDPNLLRFPEVVLERIQIKIEDDLTPSINTDGEDGKKETKDEELPNQTQQNGEASYYTRGSSVHRSRGGISGKERRKDAVRAGHRFGCNGSLSEMERGGGHRRGGKKKRGGWHHLAFRDRQQLQRKLKKHNMAYTEEERQRGQRFSEEENEVLVANVLNHYRELCGQSSVKGSATQKRRLWQEVVNNVNSVAKTYRTIEVCKKRYGDCRRAVKLKMAALEQQALGRGDPHEQIRFNSWEEKLWQKISALMSDGGQHVLDTCEPTMMDLASLVPLETPGSPLCHSWAPTVDTAGLIPLETPGSPLCHSWAPTVDTAAPSIVQPEASAETYSEGEEATSPLDVQIVSEWSEVESPCIPAPQTHSERAELPEPPAELKASPNMDIGEHVTEPQPPITDQDYQRLQEEFSQNLRHVTRTHSSELHKLREHVVEGNSRIVQHLEGLATEVRELNAHVRQIHMNQAHFNLMFQNYLSDTKQFYGAMVQAMRNLQQPQAVSPMATPASSPAPSPKPHPTPPNPLLLTAMSDFTALSPAGSAEPASASSTASELPVYIRNRTTRRSASTFQPPKNH